MIYALARNIPQADASLRRGEWRRADFVGLELRAETLGIIGLARRTPRRGARAGMEMTLIGSDPFVTAEAASAHAIELIGMDDVLAARTW